MGRDGGEGGEAADDGSGGGEEGEGREKGTSGEAVDLEIIQCHGNQNFALKLLSLSHTHTCANVP